MTFPRTGTDLYSFNFDLTNFTILETSSNDGDSAVCHNTMNGYVTKNCEFDLNCFFIAVAAVLINAVLTSNSIHTLHYAHND